MKKLNCIAVDDEPLALEVIKRFGEKIPALNLMETFQNPIEAVEFIKENPVDLVFLDIQMPDLTGLEFINSFAEKPMVIFTTAFADYAIESYEVDAIDYLLKPVLFDRFYKAVNKALMKVEESGTEILAEEDFMFIKSDTRIFKINYNDILYIEGMRDYIAVHTPKQRILTLMSMTRMLDKLPKRRFMRVHKSYIIGIGHIHMIQNNRVLINQKEIPISNSYKEQFLKFIENK
ncbi:MAG: LytTR family DNA-binding domain-containing protein [Bacteroidia bacterium]|nr:LytTR family DNA-binding domain-containing protein [Bacteroidia bacterium]